MSGQAVRVEVIDTEAKPIRSLDEWALLVRADLGSAVEGLINAGLHLHQAKVEHPGTFAAWLRSGAVGIGAATAYRFMKIADALDGFSPLRNLPPDRMSLYELSRLGRPQLEQAVDQGWITVGMRPHEVRRIASSIRLNGSPDPRWINGTPAAHSPVPTANTEPRPELEEQTHKKWPSEDAQREWAAEDLANTVYDAVWCLANLSPEDLELLGPRFALRLSDEVRPLIPAVVRTLHFISSPKGETYE